MTNNIEKLAKIGEKKLMNDLTAYLIDIKQYIEGIVQVKDRDLKEDYINEKIKSYKNLIATCKNCGLDITEAESIFNQIINNRERYIQN